MPNTRTNHGAVIPLASSSSATDTRSVDVSDGEQVSAAASVAFDAHRGVAIVTYGDGHREEIQCTWRALDPSEVADDDDATGDHYGDHLLGKLERELAGAKREARLLRERLAADVALLTNALHATRKARDNQSEKRRQLRAENERLTAELDQAREELLMLAKLASPTPQFYNPMQAWYAAKLRDEILASPARLSGDAQGGDR